MSKPEDRIPEEFSIYLCGRQYDSRVTTYPELMQPALADLIFSIPGGRKDMEYVVYTILMAGQALERGQRSNVAKAKRKP